MLETHAHLLFRVLGWIALTLFLGLITGGALSSVPREVYFSLQHALWVIFWLPSMATVGVILCEEYWPENPFNLETPERWWPFWLKSSFYGTPLSYLGAIPIYTVRWIFE